MPDAALEETTLSTTAAPAPVSPPEPASEPIADSKTLRAAVVCGPAGKLPSGYDLVVVAEGRAYVEAVFDPPATEGDEPTLVSPAASSAVLDGYPAGAALYFRTDPAVRFPENSAVLTLGVDVLQWKFAGFTVRASMVSVGPCHPAYAAANLAYQRGAAVIDILGLAEGEKERLRPWLDAVPTNAVEPAQVAVSIL